MDDDPWARQQGALEVIAESLQPQMPQDPYATILDASRPLAWDVDVNSAALAFAGVTVRPQDVSPLRVSRAVGVSAATLRRWRAHPHFCSVVDGMARQAGAQAMQHGLALKETRIREIAQRHGLLKEIIENRQEWWAEEAPDEQVEVNPTPTGEDVVQVPGISTGLVVLRRRRLGDGGFGREVLEAELDLPLLRELRELERQMAMETGQWSPSSSGASGGPVIKLYASLNVDAV